MPLIFFANKGLYLHQLPDSDAPLEKVEESSKLKISSITSDLIKNLLQAREVYKYVATKFSSLPTNVSYYTQGALDEPPLDVSNGINQSDGQECCQFDLLIPEQVIPQL
ncbi:hypothetical protein DSO57_1023847 [Entomophthora muscae]|uniref:Uncharacterized protein n=1 Tax=Entomophthora muscae TaxID=34485 RepID=A0ACC2S517_9FUNG|nr:hypothetical protein DSO57_1023847 [Entomophthora muscae]